MRFNELHCVNDRLTIQMEFVSVAGAGGNQSPGERDGGRGREAEGATERGGETDESQSPTRCVCVSFFFVKHSPFLPLSQII